MIVSLIQSLIGKSRQPAPAYRATCALGCGVLSSLLLISLSVYAGSPAPSSNGAPTQIATQLKSAPLASESLKALILGLPNHSKKIFTGPIKPDGYSRVEHAVQAAGYELLLAFHPSLRSLALANTGQIDGLYSRPSSIEHQYRNLVRVDTPTFYIHPAIYSTQSFDWRDGNKRRLATQRGSIGYLNRVKAVAFSDAFDIIFTNSTLQGLQQLQAGRIDALIVSVEQMAFFEHQYPQLTQNLQRLKTNLPPMPLYTYLHKKHRSLARQLAALLPSNLNTDNQLTAPKETAENPMSTEAAEEKAGL